MSKSPNPGDEEVLSCFLELHRARVHIVDLNA